MHSISNRLQTVRLSAKYWNTECTQMRCSRVSLLYCRIRRVCCDSIFDEQTRPRNRLYSGRALLWFLLKSDSEIPMCYATEREEEKERGREIRRARASRDRVIISPLNFLIPHPFTHPAATSSFLRESPREIAIWCIPDVSLTLLLTRISGRRYRARGSQA